MTYAGWHINLLSFEGKEDEKAQLAFKPGLTLIYGASNTGKSLAVKALDFMLGGSQELPNIAERRPYDRLFMAMTLANSRQSCPTPASSCSTRRSLLTATLSRGRVTS